MNRLGRSLEVQCSDKLLKKKISNPLTFYFFGHVSPLESLDVIGVLAFVRIKHKLVENRIS